MLYISKMVTSNAEIKALQNKHQEKVKQGHAEIDQIELKNRNEIN